LSHKQYSVNVPGVKLQSGNFKELASPLGARTKKMIDAAVIAEYEKVTATRPPLSSDARPNAKAEPPNSLGLTIDMHQGVAKQRKTK
jgi:hypothetical protein